MPLPLDHSKATARISFAGLLLVREAEDKKHCEVKVLSCDKHKLTVTIQEITFAPDGTTKLKSRNIDPKLDLAQDIEIEVKEPWEPGIEFCKDGATPFDRKTGAGNDEDIRWVLDFENAELNGNPIEVDPNGTKHFAPTIYIDHCKLYAQPPTKEEEVVLAREDISNKNDRVFLGRAAFMIGADLLGAKIELSNGGQAAAAVSLEQKAFTQYEITVENECQLPSDFGEGSDFRLYYDALRTKKKFDLRRVIESENANAANDPLSGIPPGINFSSDNFPRICIPGGSGSSK